LAVVCTSRSAWSWRCSSATSPHRGHVAKVAEGATVALERGLTHVRGQRPEARGQRPEARGQRPEARGQRPEARGQRPEGRGQRAEARGQRPEARGQNTPWAFGSRQRSPPNRGEAALTSGIWLLSSGPPRLRPTTKYCRAATTWAYAEGLPSRTLSAAVRSACRERMWSRSSRGIAAMS